MSVTTFILGLQVGRRDLPAAALPPRDALISEEARTGNLELLLQKVSATEKEAHLDFPQALGISTPLAPPAELGPDGLPLPVAEAAPAAAVLTPPDPKEGAGSIALQGGTDLLGVAPADGYAVQVAATDRAHAQALVTELAGKGVDAYVIDAVVDGQAERRVRVGGYASEAAATAAVADLQQVVGGTLAVVKAP
jgi:septal ring-binding cell division protein DamX